MKKIFIFGIFCLVIFLLSPNNVVKATDGCSCSVNVSGSGMLGSCSINGQGTIGFETSVTAGSILTMVDTTNCPMASTAAAFLKDSYTVTESSCNGINFNGDYKGYKFSVSCSGGTGPAGSSAVVGGDGSAGSAPGVPLNASGQVATIGGIDFRCWKLEDCIERRKTLGISEENAKLMGIYQGLDAVKACGGKETPDKSDKVGFCTAITNTETRTSFAGKSNFTGILDFIQYIYQYAVVIGGVLALIMLIIAGFQWTISGGNSEQKQAAQKRISGAFMGLLILFLSYTVLNTISPYLVNLRAPQTWMINTVSLAPKYCKDLNAPALVAFAYGQSEAIPKEELDNRFRAVVGYNVDPVVGAGCGDNFFVENGSGMTCLGTYCGTPTTPPATSPVTTPPATTPAGTAPPATTPPVSTLTVPSNTGPNTTCYKRTEQEPYQCLPGNIMGRIINSDIKAELPIVAEVLPGRDTWVWPWALTHEFSITRDEVKLRYVCKDGSDGWFNVGTGDVEELDATKKIQYYQVTLIDDINEVVDKCDGNGGLKGFVLGFNLQEGGNFTMVGSTGEFHYIGINGSNAIDLGDLGAFEKIKITAPAQYFFTTTSLSLGLAFDIDVKYICDIDDNYKDRLACYKDLGFN